MPPNTVYVGRPSKWGNPFIVNAGIGMVGWMIHSNIVSKEQAIEAFSIMVEAMRKKQPNEFEKVYGLRGKNLACWCPLDQPCHADVLLKIANE